MAHGRVSYPSVFVVDSDAKFPPPLPPKPGQTRIQYRRNHLIQNILLVLVCLALCGIIVEGYFIYKLHKNNQTSEAVSENAGVLSIMTSSPLTFLWLTFRKSFLLLSCILSWLSALQHSFRSLIYSVLLDREALSLLHKGPKPITHDSWIK